MKHIVMPLPLMCLILLGSLMILLLELAASDIGDSVAENVLCTATKLEKSKNRDEVALRADCALGRGKHKRVRTQKAKVVLNFVNRQERLMRCDVWESGFAECRPARAANKRRN